MGGVATVVSAANLHKFIFTSTGLPALADAKVYELWIMGPGGKATRAGLLAAIAVLFATLSPWALAAAVRIGLE